ncbi:MAG: hypothetical protein RIS64_3742 [Bacteroidota bacterium]|jgi:hypothetical protein
MAKKINPNTAVTSAKSWREGELIKTFYLTRIAAFQTPLMKEWLNASMPTFDVVEQAVFEKVLSRALNNIEGWNEEELKMKFICHILDLGQMIDDPQVIGYFDKTISTIVENIKLTVKSDFMIAKGILDVFDTPYFHFQEYKPNKNPTGDSMGQLIEAFLIAQEKNQNGKPLYGVEVVGKQWVFVVMEGKSYCISKPFICTDKADLLKIIAVLRKFKEILYHKLL